MRRIYCLLTVLCLLLGSVSCGVEKTGITVVATSFPAYDFARAAAGAGAEIVMLVPPGTDAHHYEPSPEDIMAVERADVFVCTGGASDVWVERVLSSVSNQNVRVVRMMEHSSLLYDKSHNGHDHSGDEHAHHADEHVWMSPDNAAAIVKAVADALTAVDGDKKYKENAQAYCAEIARIEKETRAVLCRKQSPTLVVADRFPLRYFCEHYSLNFVAAFDACDLFCDASAATVARLTDAVRAEELPFVYYIESGSGHVAETVCRETGCDKLMLNSLHTVSRDDFESGMTYLDVMEHNKNALERGLR